MFVFLQFELLVLIVTVILRLCDSPRVWLILNSVQGA